MQGVLSMINLEKLRSLIKEKGWTVSYFCKLMGHSRSWLIDMSKGKGLPDENTLRAIADKLDTTVDYLTDKTDVKEQKNKPVAESDELGPKGKVIWERLKQIRSLSEDDYRLAVAQLELILNRQDKKDNH